MNFRLHHTGVAVADVATAAADYVTRLGYQCRTAIVHDPLQGAYVQFLQLDDSGVYLELVQPDGPGSKLSQAIQKGGGLNHLCYSTDDIQGACEHLRAQGLFLIAPPVPAVAFNNRRIAWLMGRDRVLVELVERGPANEL